MKKIYISILIVIYFSGCGDHDLNPPVHFQQGVGIYCEPNKPVISPNGALVMMVGRSSSSIVEYSVSLQPWEPDGNWIF